MDERVTYYIRGLFRQGNAPLARDYLGFHDTNGVPISYLIQDTPVWNDVRIPMSSVRPGVGAPTAQPFQPTGVGSLRAYRFNRGVTQRLEFELQVPHGTNEDPIYGVRLHVHWACGLSSPAAAVGWFVDASVADIGFNFPAPTTHGPATTTPTVAFRHLVTNIHTFTGLHDSAVIVGNIYRNAADAYLGDDVFGLSLDAHYVVQRLGSIEDLP